MGSFVELARPECDQKETSNLSDLEYVASLCLVIRWTFDLRKNKSRPKRILGQSDCRQPPAARAPVTISATTRKKDDKMGADIWLLDVVDG